MGDTARQNAQAFQFLRLPELFFRPFAFADVGNERDRHRALRRRNKIQGNLYWKFGPVFSHGSQIHSGAHGPRARSGEIVGPVAHVQLPKPLRNEKLQLVAGQFGPAITEHLFGFGIYEFDSSVRIDSYDGLRGRFQIGTKFGFAIAQLPLGFLLPGYVAGYLRSPNDLSVPTPDW